MIDELLTMRTRQLCLSALVLAMSSGVAVSARQGPAPVRPIASHQASIRPVVAADARAAQQTITQTCVGCHSDRAKAGGLSLAAFSVAAAGEHLDTTEKMIRKLRAGQMPPAAAGAPTTPRSTRSPRRSRPGRRQGRGRRAGPPFVPTSEPGRVRAVGARPARPRGERRRLPAARHQERQLRQHRRRPDSCRRR